MFNLLPEDEKQKVEAAYVAKRYHLILLFVVVVAVMAVVFIAPSFMAVMFQKREAVADLEAFRSLSSEDKRLLNRRLTDGQNKVSALSLDRELPSISDLYELILARTGSRVKLHLLSYNQAVSTNVVSIRIRGIAQTRESLSTFVRELQQEELFRSVTFPVANLAKERDIDFTIDILLTEEKVAEQSGGSTNVTE